jgi:hypothetical protein
VINPAVFAYSLYVKFQDWRNLLPIVLLLIAPCLPLVLTAIIPHPPFDDDSQKGIARMISGYFANPVCGMILCYIFISDGPAGRKLVAESDSLSLLFTRAITRFSYVMSKYFAGVIGAILSLSAGLFLAWLLGMCLGINKIDISPLAFATIVCNVASWASLVVFLHSAPPVVAILTYLFFNGIGGVGSMFFQAEYPKEAYMEYVKTVALFMHRWLGDVLPVTVNLQAMMSAASFDFYETAIYFSNITLFLLFATFAMSKREFSYGSD